MRIRKVVLMALITTMVSSCVKDSLEDEVQAKANRKASGLNVALGLGYLEQGDVQRSKRKLLLAMKQAPKSAKAAGAFAYYLEKTGEKRQAQDFYLKAIRFGGSKGPQLNNYGAYLCREGKYIEAIGYFNRASRDLHYENSAGALENAGLCAVEIPNLSLAESYFKKALEQDPRRLNSIYELAKISFGYKRYDGALKYVQQFEKEGAIQPAVAWLGYQAASKLGQGKKADNYAWILRNRFSKSAEYQKLLVSNQNYDKQKHGVS